MKVLFVLALCLAVAAARRAGRIVGGSDVDRPGKYPWQASLQFKSSSSHTCGASLISSTWLTCAAHCVGSGASAYKIVLGMHDKDTKRQGSPTDFDVASITSHPGWSNDGSRGFPNDISVIRLSRAASSNQFISPINLPQAGQDFYGSTCVISGWGRTYGGGPLPNVLQEAPIDILSQADCQYYYGSIITGYHVCVMDYWGESRGSCNGDSGGPLSCQVGGQWYLAGATSFGIVNCPPSYPSVYADVPYFRSWIRQTTGL